MFFVTLHALSKYATGYVDDIREASLRWLITLPATLIIYERLLTKITCCVEIFYASNAISHNHRIKNYYTIYRKFVPYTYYRDFNLRMVGLWVGWTIPHPQVLYRKVVSQWIFVSDGRQAKKCLSCLDTRLENSRKIETSIFRDKVFLVSRQAKKILANQDELQDFSLLTIQALSKAKI